MRYAGIIYDDTAAAPGLCLSFYTQGCPIHCPGCHNPETWDFNGGHEFTSDTMDRILAGLTKNGIMRSLAILGGEPLAPSNIFLTAMIIQTVRDRYPSVPIWIWTGYEMEEILFTSNPHLKLILSKVNAIIAGPYDQSLRDVTLPYRGSSNQKVFLFDHEKNICYNKENETEEHKLNV